MSVTMYHDPRCGKSHAMHALLEPHGERPDVAHGAQTPPDAERLDAVMRILARVLALP